MSEYNQQTEGLYVNNPYHIHWHKLIQILAVKETTYLCKVVRTGEEFEVPHDDVTNGLF